MLNVAITITKKALPFLAAAGIVKVGFLVIDKKMEKHLSELEDQLASKRAELEEDLRVDLEILEEMFPENMLDENIDQALKDKVYVVREGAIKNANKACAGLQLSNKQNVDRVIKHYVDDSVKSLEMNAETCKMAKWYRGQARRALEVYGPSRIAELDAEKALLISNEKKRWNKIKMLLENIVRTVVLLFI